MKINLKVKIRIILILSIIYFLTTPSRAQSYSGVMDSSVNKKGEKSFTLNILKTTSKFSIHSIIEKPIISNKDLFSFYICSDTLWMIEAFYNNTSYDITYFIGIFEVKENKLKLLNKFTFYESDATVPNLMKLYLTNRNLIFSLNYQSEPLKMEYTLSNSLIAEMDNVLTEWKNILEENKREK